MIINGVINISIGAGLIMGLALSVIFTCCSPLGALPLVLGVFELIYGIRLVGTSPVPVTFSTLQTVAILEILAIFASNPISLVIGIVNLVLLNDPEVRGFFSGQN
jgi:hypothetical protein